MGCQISFMDQKKRKKSVHCNASHIVHPYIQESSVLPIEMQRRAGQMLMDSLKPSWQDERGKGDDGLAE